MTVFKTFSCTFFLLILAFSHAQTLESCEKMIVEGVNEMSQKNHITSLEILTKARAIAHENNWTKQEFLAVNNIGANYYMMLDYGEALENYLDAYKIALKSLDNKHEMIVLNNIAILYSKEQSFDKAEEYFQKAYDIAKENNDSVKIGIYSVNLAVVAVKKSETNKADHFLNVSFNHLKKTSTIYLQAIVVKAQNLILKKQYDEAKKIAENLLPQLNTSELSEQRISILMLLADVYENQNDNLKAIEYTKQALYDPQSTIENKIEAYQKLTELYRKANEINLAFLYKDSVIAAKDTLNKIKNGKLFENSRIKFELQNYQNELLESQKKLKSERRVFYIIIGGIILLIVITSWAIWNYYTKLKQRKIIAENNQKITELELQKEKSNKLILEQQLSEQSALAQLEKEKFKNEIETKNRQLASKALSISTRNELIESIIEALAKENEVQKNENLKKRIFELRNHLKKESEWDEFFTHFEEANYGFISSLKEKHAELTSNDIRFLSYIYMNLSTKEISSLLNITVEACRKRKERIIKKMNLLENENLYDYISSI